MEDCTVLSKHLSFSMKAHCDVTAEAANRNCDCIGQRKQRKSEEVGKSAKHQGRNTNEWRKKKPKHLQLKTEKINFFRLPKRTCTANTKRVNMPEVLMMSAYSPIIKDLQKQQSCALLQYLQLGQFLNEELSWSDGKVFSSKPVPWWHLKTCNINIISSNSHLWTSGISK